MNHITANVLGRFARVKQTRPDQWMAACPICNSQRGRPVAIKETGDGRVLIWGFCGHETGQLLDTLGLTLAELFIEPLAHHLAPVKAPKLHAREALEIIEHEALIVGMLALELRNDGDLWDEQWTRLAQAEARISWALDAYNAG